MSLSVQTSYGTYTEDQLRDLKLAIKEGCSVKVQIKHQQDNFKDIVNSTADKLNLPKDLIKSLVDVEYKQSYQEVTAKQSEFQALYEAMNEVK